MLNTLYNKKKLISIHKLCPQSVLNHSAVHFQGIAMKIMHLVMVNNGDGFISFSHLSFLVLSTGPPSCPCFTQEGCPSLDNWFMQAFGPYKMAVPGSKAILVPIRWQPLGSTKIILKCLPEKVSSPGPGSCKHLAPIKWQSLARRQFWLL